MTLPRSEQILAAVFTKLDTISGVNCYRSRADALSRRQAPAIILEPGGINPARPAASTSKLDWAMEITIAIHTRGAIPDQLAASYYHQVHGLLLSDRSLGGLALDVLPGPVDFQREQADQTAGWQVCQFTINFRTRITDISQ